MYRSFFDRSDIAIFIPEHSLDGCLGRTSPEFEMSCLVTPSVLLLIPLQVAFVALLGYRLTLLMVQIRSLPDKKL